MAQRLSLERLAALLPLRGDRHELRLTTPPVDGTVELAIVRVESGEAFGVLALAAESPATLDVLHLWVAPPLRGYGAGSEAAALLLIAATRSGFDAIHAWAHPGLGLSVYFWIRMGLHPLHGPGPNAGLRFERTLTRSATAQGSAARLRVAPHLRASPGRVR